MMATSAGAHTVVPGFAALGFNVVVGYPKEKKKWDTRIVPCVGPRDGSRSCSVSKSAAVKRLEGLMKGSPV